MFNDAPIGAIDPVEMGKDLAFELRRSSGRLYIVATGSEM
jgi:hypothetical protein